MKEYMVGTKRFWQLLLVLMVLVVIVLGGMAVGPVSLNWWRLLSGQASQTESQVFWKLRMPRVLLAFFAGSSLALAGTVFQSLLRNVLASPFTLGVSSGAACGAAAFLRWGAAAGWVGMIGVGGSAFVGAAITALLVLSLARVVRSGGSNAILLAGIVVSFFLSSLIVLLQYLSDLAEVFRVTRWLMGSLTVVGHQAPLVLGIVSVLGLIIVYRQARLLDLLSIDDDAAASRGVVVRVAQYHFFLFTALLVGVVVAQCGVIGFVGIVAPYCARLWVGARHRLLLPLAWCFGGGMLVICDGVARTIAAPAEVPVGVLTALLGGPFFLWLLIKRGERLTLST